MFCEVFEKEVVPGMFYNTPRQYLSDLTPSYELCSTLSDLVCTLDNNRFRVKKSRSCKEGRVQVVHVTHA